MNTSHSAYDRDSGTVDLTVLLADCSRRKGLKITSPSGRLYVRAGRDDEFEVARLGPGGGFCWEREFSARRTRELVEAAIDAADSSSRDQILETDSVQELYPAKLLDF
jgi:hypothetical protein